MLMRPPLRSMQKWALSLIEYFGQGPPIAEAFWKTLLHSSQQASLIERSYNGMQKFDVPVRFIASAPHLAKAGFGIRASMATNDAAAKPAPARAPRPTLPIPLEKSFIRTQ